MTIVLMVLLLFCIGTADISGVLNILATPPTVAAWILDKTGLTVIEKRLKQDPLVLGATNCKKIERLIEGWNEDKNKAPTREVLLQLPGVIINVAPVFLQKETESTSLEEIKRMSVIKVPLRNEHKKLGYSFWSVEGIRADILFLFEGRALTEINYNCRKYKGYGRKMRL